ncbi:hypothetical protein ILUMI_19377, partial [Ignelater luminosus]
MAVIGGPVKLPPDFDLQSSNAANEWKFWKSTFEDYLVATGQDEAQDKVKLSILRNRIGVSSAKIMTTFNIPSDQENNYALITKSIDEYVNPRINECFERYNFLKRVQSKGESFEHFLTECKQLVKSCNYNAIDPQKTNEDKTLRDKTLIGIRDPSTREALLRIDQLTLEKAITFCRTSEQEEQERENMINVVEHFLVHDNVLHIDKFAGNVAFAISCTVKNVKTIECNSNSSSTSDLFVNTIRVNNVHHKQNHVWDEIVSIENRKLKIKVDTGADVSIMPLKVFKKLDSQFKIRPTNYVLKAFEASTLKPTGVVRLHCNYK